MTGRLSSPEMLQIIYRSGVSATQAKNRNKVRLVQVLASAGTCTWFSTVNLHDSPDKNT